MNWWIERRSRRGLYNIEIKFKNKTSPLGQIFDTIVIFFIMNWEYQLFMMTFSKPVDFVFEKIYISMSIGC